MSKEVIADVNLDQEVWEISQLYLSEGMFLIFKREQ